MPARPSLTPPIYGFRPAAQERFDTPHDAQSPLGIVPAPQHPHGLPLQPTAFNVNTGNCQSSPAVRS